MKKNVTSKIKRSKIDFYNLSEKDTIYIHLVVSKCDCLWQVIHADRDDTSRKYYFIHLLERDPDCFHLYNHAYELYHHMCLGIERIQA